MEKYFTLYNGTEVPAVGFGTWLLDDRMAEKAVSTAIEAGYRFIDTAQAYMNEKGVGEGIRASGMKRCDLFVASKIAAEKKSYREAKDSIDETLERMGLDYLDQMIIHSPQPWTEFGTDKHYYEENREVWRALEEAYKEGKVRVIGVSNFKKDDLDSLIASAEIVPMVDQILLHISNTDKNLLSFLEEKKILPEAYSPIGHGEILRNEKIMKMAVKYGVTVPQLCIKYVCQLGAVALPKATQKAHIVQNFEQNFTITEEDMKALLEMSKITSYGKSDIFPVFSGKPLSRSK